MEKKKLTNENESGIPSGIYCYDFLGFEEKEVKSEDDISDYKLKIKPCTYFKKIDGLNGFCKIKKAAIKDMRKICGIDEDID